MGEIPEYNFDDLGDSGNDLEEHAFEFSGDEFSFTVADVRNAMQVKKELKDAQNDLAAVKKENAEYRKMVEELREERDLEYNARRMAKNKCYWLKQMYGGLVEFMLDLLGHLETEKKGRRGPGRGCILKTGDLKMLKTVPARLKSLIGRLEDAKVKEDFRGFDVALEKVMKSARDLQTKLRGDEDPEDNVGTVVGDGESGRNDLVEPTVIPIPVPMSTEVDVNPDGDVVPMETVDGEHEVLPPKTRHAVNPKNSRKCLCGYTSRPSKVKIHVQRVTIDLKNARGSFVCPVCGDKLVSKRMLRRHLTCHKSPKPVPVESAQMSRGQSPSKKAIKSGDFQTKLGGNEDPEDNAGTVGNGGSGWNDILEPTVIPIPVPMLTEVEVDPDVDVVPMETVDGEHSEEVLPPKTRHAVNPKNSRECLCGYTCSISTNVLIHVRRLTIDQKKTKGAFVCHICGDRLTGRKVLRGHLACHKSPKLVPRAPVQSNGSSENGQLVGSAMMSEGQSPSINVNKSGPEVTSPSSSAKNPEAQVEMDQEDQANAADQRPLRAATSSTRKHHLCPGNPYRCICGFSSRKVRNHIWRVTVGKHSTSGAHICKLCGDRFRYRNGLNGHMARHRISPSPIPKAGFRKSISVVVQTEADEDEVDGEMPVLTQQCPASWIAQDVMPAPTTTTDVQEDASSVPLVRSPNKYTNVKCPSCGQRFPFRCQLWKHCMQVHNVRIPATTPPHECHLCKESFKKYADYFNHHFSAHLDSMEKKI